VLLLLLRPQVRLYDVLFKSEAPDALGDSWLEDINAASLEVVTGAMVNPHLAATAKVNSALYMLLVVQGGGLIV
jgi:hypothetical protein